MSTLRHALAEGGPCAVELRNYRKDGTHFDNQVKLTLVYTGDGALSHYIGIQLDVTERHRLASQVRRQQEEARQYYEQMFTRNTAPKLLIDPDTGRIVDANPAALDFYGYSVEAMRVQRIQDINQLSPQEVEAEMARARREERRYFQFRNRLASGEIRDVKVYSGPVRVAGKEYLHSIVHDVSDVTHYQRWLEEYKRIFEALPVGIYRNTPGPWGRFLQANPALASMLEADSVEALLDQPVAQLYSDAEARKAFSDELLAVGEVYKRELHLHTLRGRPIWIAITARVQQTDAGELVFDGVAEDISERKRAEEEAQKSHGRLRQALEAAPFPTMIHDRQSGAVELINRVWSQLTGYTAEDLPTVDEWRRRALGGEPGVRRQHGRRG